MNIYQALLILLFCIPVKAQNVQGRVIDATNGEGIPFALVTVLDFNISTKTDLNGNFQFSISIPNQLSLKVSAATYEEDVFIFYQTDKTLVDLILTLEPCHLEIGEVHVVHSKWNVQKEVVSHIESKKLSDLQVIPSNNLSDVLSIIPGVYSSKTTAGISKPVIRGLSGGRIVTYWNDLRIENQQWGGDHGMALTELGVDRIEIMKGPASVLYGTDALAGAIVISDEPYAQQNHIESYISSKVESNTKGVISNVGTKISLNNIRSSVYFSHFDLADFQLPDGRYAKSTAAKGYAAKFLLGVNRKNWVSNFKHFSSYQRNGIPGHSHDTIFNPENFISSQYYRTGAKPIQSIYNHFTLLENKLFMKKSSLMLILGNTINDLEEYGEKVSVPEIAMKLNSLLYHVKWNLNLNKKHELLCGIQGFNQINQNGTNSVIMLIPDAVTNDAGIYINWIYESGGWTIQSALRGDMRTINTRNTTYDFSGDYFASNYSLGAIRKFENTIFRLNISSGTRAPHTSELLSDGVHHGGLRYEIGDLSLPSEQANQIDLTAEYHGEHLDLIINPFFSVINDIIVLVSANTMINGFPAYNYTSKDLAFLYGGDFSWHYHPHFSHGLHLDGSFSLVLAEDDNGNALPMIPQTRIIQEIRYDFSGKKKFRFKNVVVRYSHFFDQDRIAQYETPTSGFDLLDVGLNVRWSTALPIHFSCGIKNTLNIKYFDHLSPIKQLGLYQPGWNAYLSIKMNFEYKINER